MQETSNKSNWVKFRVSSQELSYIQESAKEAEVSISDFIRINIFDLNKITNNVDNSKSQFNCDHDREMMRLVVRMFIYVEQLANKSLDKETKQSIDEAAANLLKDWGYE